jgi:hypothetical protein
VPHSVSNLSSAAEELVIHSNIGRDVWLRASVLGKSDPWEAVRERANVDCRFYNLRHTALTKNGGSGVPESTMLALAGHMSRAMLERYSHVRMNAKRQAVQAPSLTVEPQPSKVQLIAPDAKVHSRK